jgi:hypothetical protein
MWTKKFWQATVERMVRGAAISVSAVYFGGDKVFDTFNVHTWQDVSSIGIAGAVGSLVLALIGGAVGKGDGPSLTGTEVVD